MLVTVTILLAAVVLAVLAVGVACVLGWANRAFHVEVDPKVEAVLDVLPGANCGGCGYVGCGEYAEAVVTADADVSLCAPGGAGCTRRLAEILGVDVAESFPYRAVVHCGAKTPQRLPVNKLEYRGEPTCRAANLIAGVQWCTYGCLGLSDCVEACKYDAIHVIDGVAVVDYQACIGCKACAVACPRNIITMVPFKSDQMMVVACSNKDGGPDVKSVCDIGCIGCKICAKKSELVDMEGSLPIIDYDQYEADADFSAALEKCPRESLLFVGKPSAEDLAAVAGEELPDRIVADFKTTVDDTEWRG